MKSDLDNFKFNFIYLFIIKAFIKYICKIIISKTKLNSQKHISVKNPVDYNLNTNKLPRAKNFANIVRNRKRNQNLSTTESCVTDPSTIENYTTPFTNPMWKRTR